MFERKPKTFIYFIILLGAFLLIFVRNSFITSLKFKITGSASLPIRIVSFPFKEMKKILFYHRTYDEYIRLKRDNNELRSRMVGFDELLRENTRLEKLFNFKRQSIYSSVASNVIGRDPSNWNATLIVDKGSEDGIEIGMPVMSAVGIVGKIAEVSAAGAKVVLISDPSFSVTALARRSREVGLVSGTLQGMCRMKYLSAQADIKVGDEIITSKLSSTFPEGLLIGEVISVYSAKDNPSASFIVKPTVSLSQIEEVLIIQKK
ncbi:MAG: rod shape-determining protein MreC [Candidatus Omnitrophica bacterium]|nr:rod shape-determining protein MreC [Candidatus Omnitrophota bacterium]